MTDQEQTQIVTTPAPVEPVLPAAGPPSAHRGRWAVALIAVALVAAITTGLVFALAGHAANSTVLAYVPAGTVVYGEARLDLPGDQAQKLAGFLSKFPGFADQAALEAKIAETLDKLIGSASNQKQTYTSDIKPWFGGELAFAVGALPDPTAAGGSSSVMSDARGLALVSVTDATLAKAWFTQALTSSGVTATDSTYGGTTLTLISHGSDAPKGALAIVDGKVALLGTIDSVKAAIDTKGGSPFGSSDNVKRALDSAPGDHLGLVYVDMKALLAWEAKTATGASSEMGGMSSAFLTSMAGYSPDWEAFWLRVEDDALVMQATAPKAAKVLGPTEDRVSPLSKHIPSSAVVASVSNDYGATLLQILDLYKSEPTIKPMLDQLEQGAALLGGTQGVVGWMGDTAFVVDHTGDSISGGVLIVPTSRADADKLSNALKAFVALGGAQQGLTVSQQDHGGTPITILDLGEHSDLAQLAAGAGDLPPGITLPKGHVQIAWAITDDLVVIGSGPDFVARVLDTTDATSLASTDRYKDLTGRFGTGDGTSFVDISAIRVMSEGLAKSVDPSSLSSYDSDVKPFLSPFDAMYVSSSVGGDLTRSTIVITVK
jgi:Protein of unknown function (DUF3352)